MIKYILILFLLSGLFAQDESWKLYDDSDVAIINITTSPAAVEYMYAFPESDSLHMCSVHFKNAWIDETIDSVAIRLRGNTSRQSQKKSFKLNFDHFVDGREFYDVDKMNLNGEHNDPSIIRSRLAWSFFHDIGTKASRAAHAAVYINGKYYGLYVSVEHYDKEFLKKNFTDPSGDLFKCLYPAELLIRGAGLPGDYDPVMSGNPGYTLKTNEDIHDYSKLADFIEMLNTVSDFQFPMELEKVMDVTETIKVMAMDVLLGSWDDYWSNVQNYYLYNDPSQGKFYFIPYDYDNIMSVDWFDRDWATEDIYNWYRLRNEFRPLVDRILDNNQYHNLYTHFIEYYSDNVFKLDLWEGRMDTIYNKIRPYAETDTFRVKDWGFTMDDFDNSYSESYSNQHVKRGIREYVNARNTSVKEQLDYVQAKPILYKMQYTPEQPIAGDSITFNVSVFDESGIAKVELQYLINESNLTTKLFSYSPLANTKHVEDNDNWTVTIPVPGADTKIDYVVVVTGNDGSFQTNPPLDFNTIIIPGSGSDQVVINEFLAQNTAINMDENGQYEDWIELYNKSDSAIDLAGYYLTDKTDALTKWVFPDSGSVINAGGYLLIWCDEDQKQGVLHTNFKLAAAGEFIALTGPDGVTVLDSLSFGPQTENISYGRNPDGSESWEFLTPTPGSSNTITSLKDINENPRQFKLTAFPNPFNNTVNISYYLKENKDVTITIYNVLGKKVWEQKYKKQSNGNHSVRWNGDSDNFTEVSSGLYIVHVKKGSQFETAKIILLK